MTTLAKRSQPKANLPTSNKIKAPISTALRPKERYGVGGGGHRGWALRETAAPPAQLYQRDLCTGPAQKPVVPVGSCQFSVCWAGQIRRHPYPQNNTIKTSTTPPTAAFLLVLLVLLQRNILSSFILKTTV